MRTRKESAEEKRKAEEEIKRVEREKREKKRFKRRKLIGPHDLPVDRNLPKIYIDPADVGEAEVKVEIKEEQIEVIEDQLEEDGVIEAIQQNEVVEEEETEVNEETMKVVLVAVLPLLDHKDMFTCRLVSMQWRGLVDDFIEDSVVPKPYDDKAYLEKLRRSPYHMCPLPQFELHKITYEFEEEAEVEKFNEAMKVHMESGQSPFVGGATVILKTLLVTSSSVLSPSTQVFLEKFGVHIRRLEINHIKEKRKELDIVGFVNFVKRCSHFVPNLETLKIYCNDFVDMNNPRTPLELADLKATLYRNELLDRMPKLNKLTSLRFNSIDDFVMKIFADIMIKPYYQTQLKQLSLNWIEELADLELNNVKDLRIDYFGSFKKNALKLEAVEKLTFYYFYLNIKDDMPQIFPNIRYLRISHWNGPTCFMRLNRNWQRANIHTLELVEFEAEQCIPGNLNIAFPHLRHLIIRGIRRMFSSPVLSGSTGGEMKLKQLFDGDTTYRTNLWESLPELEVFTFQFRDNSEWPWPIKNFVETRDGYQKYTQQKQIM